MSSSEFDDTLQPSDAMDVPVPNAAVKSVPKFRRGSGSNKNAAGNSGGI
jgi:hypothetical protein